jgi:hypothetical protein
MRGFTTIFERFVSFRRVPMRIVVITALASYALQIGAIVQGQPLFIIALYTLVPWIPAFLFEGLWKFEHYNWVAVFAIVAALQVGHLGEHSFQVVQLRFLNGTIACPPPVDNPANAERAVQMGVRPADVDATGRSSQNIVKANGSNGPAACGVFGQLDFETVHLVWDSLVWLGALWLLTKFPGNIWLWIAVAAASAHEVEHLFIGWVFFFEKDLVYSYMRQLWATTVDGNIVTARPAGQIPEATNFYEANGKAGIMGRNGLIQNVFNLSPNLFFIRPYLHFGYNTLVVVPTVIAFLVQSRKVYDEYLAKALPTLTEAQLIHTTARLARHKFEPGQVIVRQGDPADNFYIISKGQVEIIRDQSDGGPPILITRLGSGQYFGEIGLLHGGKRTATVRAAEDVEVLALDRDTFRDLMTESGDTMEDLDRIVRQRVLQLRTLQSAF